MELLEELSKWDFEHLKSAVDVEHFGPDMELRSTCPIERCGFETLHPVDWRWDFFFKSVSL